MSRLGTAIAVALLLLLCLQVASAEAGIAPENETVATSELPEAGGIASDAQGDSLVTWSELVGGEPDPEPVPRARWISASGQMGPVIDLSPGASGFQPVAAMAPSGRAFVAWRRGSGRYDALGRWVEPDGSLGPLLTLVLGEPAKMSAVELQAVVDPAGVATAAWRNGEPGSLEDVNMRRIEPNSTMGPVVPEVGKGVLELAIAALPSGSTVAVWRAGGIRVAVLTASLQIVPEALVSSNTSGTGPAVAVDGLGNGLVAWRGEPAEFEYTVLARRLDSSGAPLGDELGVEPTAQASVVIPPRVVADSADDFLVAWSERSDIGNFAAAVRRANSAGAFTGNVERLSAADLSAVFTQPALFDSGGGVVAWDSSAGMESTGVRARTIDVTAAPTADEVPLTETGAPVFSSSVPASGFAAFLIRQRDSLLVRRFLEAPVCRPVSVTLRTARPTRVPLDCSGLGIESGQAVRGPRRGELATIDVPTRTVLYTPRGGNDSFTYLLSNDGGAAQPVEVTLADKAKPRIYGVRLLRRKKGRGGLRFLVKVSEPARIKLVVARRGGRGKRGGGKRVLGRLKSGKPKRKALIRVRGRLARRLLAGGRFRVTAVATDLARNKSRPKRLRIRLKG